MFPPSFDRPRGQAAGAGSFSPAEMEILSLGIIPFAFAGCRFRPSGQVKHARKLINDGENSRRAARSFGVDSLDALSEFRQAGRVKRVASRAAELHDTVFEVRVQGRRLESTDQLVEAQWAARAAAQGANCVWSSFMSRANPG